MGYLGFSGGKINKTVRSRLKKCAGISLPTVKTFFFRRAPVFAAEFGFSLKQRFSTNIRRRKDLFFLLF